MSAADERAATALASLERNRRLLRARFAPAEGSPGNGSGAFPRSVTFRWLLTAGRNRRLVSAALQAMLRRHPLASLLCAWTLERRSRRD